MVNTSKTNGSWVQGTLLRGYCLGCDVWHPHQPLTHTGLSQVTPHCGKHLEGRGHGLCQSGTRQKPPGMGQLEPREVERAHAKTQPGNGLTRRSSMQK